MKAIQITLLVQDIELEKRIEQLEERCKKIDVPLQNIFQMTAATMPNKPFIDILLSLSDLKIFDLEEEERNKNFWKKFKFHQKKDKK